MTREEAIQLIDEIASSYYPCDKKDALEMAIKALEREPCEDAISREAILNDLKECMEVSESNYEFGEVEGLRKAIESVNEMRPVQPRLIEYEDAINREQAIKTAIEAADDWDGGYNLTRAEIIEKAIKALPSAQPKLTESEDKE